MAIGYFIPAFIGAVRPKFRHSGDKLAYAIHAVCYTQGFCLYATGRLAFADDALTTISRKEVDIHGWNDFEDKYAFLYYNPKLESQNKLLLKCYLQNNNNQISVEAVAAANTSRFVFLTLNVDDFIEQDYDPESMLYDEQFKNMDNLITLINNHILIKLLNWFPKPTSNILKNHISNMYNFSPKPDVDISTTTVTVKEKPPRRNNHYYKCCHQSLGSKFAKMHLADTKKKKKVNSSSVSKPYKRRSVKNNMKINCKSGGSKKDNGGAGGATLYDLPLHLYESMKEAAGLIEHLKTFKDDKQAMKDLDRYEFYIANSLTYHRARLPTGWTCNRDTCREDISKCYWEKVSSLES